MMEDGTTFRYSGGEEELEIARKHKERIKCLVISNELERIPKEAFCDFKSLEKLVTHNKLREIGVSAFHFCCKLADLGDLSSVVSVQGHAFANCDSLHGEISLPNATQIGSYAFVCCAKVTSIYAPNAEKIGRRAFGSCPNIAPANVTCPYGSIDKDVFEKTIFQEVEAHLRVVEAGRYSKIFKMYLINHYEFALLVESYNNFGESKPQAALRDELSPEIHELSKDFNRRHGEKGAIFQTLLEAINDPILLEAIDKGGGQSNNSAWIIPIQAYEPIEQRLKEIGTVIREISQHNRRFALEQRVRASEDKIVGTDADSLKLVPRRLRNKLTTFQRAGVKYIIDRGGRCLLADEVSYCIHYDGWRGGGWGGANYPMPRS